MSISLLDRLGGTVCEARGGALVLARYIVRTAPGRELFVNSFPVSAQTYLVPDSAGRWQLLSGDSERLEGAFPRAQALDSLDSSSIRTVGRSVADKIADGGTWIDALVISPLVPEMSKRAELQPLELLVGEYVGHLAEVCRRPRTHLRVEIERTAVSRARRFPAQAANYLAAHTEDWERPTLRAVVPKRILAVVREDQFDIYENRVAVRLVDHLVTYLGRRILEVSRLLRVFEEAGDHSSSASGGSHWRQRRIYQLWGDAIDAGEARRKAERTLRQLKHLKYVVAGLMDSVLYREVPRRAAVGTTLTMTNILTNDERYRRVADIWQAWARLGFGQAPRPRAYFEEMQDLCHSFDSYSLLIAIRALAQMGFEPTAPERPLSDGEAEVRGREQSAVLSWAAADGAITLRGSDIISLRIVPLCSAIARLDPEQLRELIADADADPEDSVTLVLYPTPSSARDYDRLEPDLSRRLYALSHDVADRGRRRVGFMPVSPWDIGSVERLARQVRWVTMTPRFLGYPPTINPPPVPEFGKGLSWLDRDVDSLRVIRAPLDHEALGIDRHATQAVEHLARLEAERESVAQRLRDAHRESRATGELNARKKALNAEIVAAETRLTALRSFQQELASALASVDDLLRCPTCAKRADSRRDFTGGAGHRFSCTCSDCSTTWGTVACPRCDAWVPTLLPSSPAWMSQAKVPGWIDRALGADVLAVPHLVGTEVGFVCQVCGETPEEKMASST
jgi:hypothetical protein